jgi:hypothetical protein
MVANYIAGYIAGFGTPAFEKYIDTPPEVDGHNYNSAFSLTCRAQSLARNNRRYFGV